MRCLNATAEVRLRTFLSPCVDDCGPYGQCKLLRTHNYLYAACECKAGEQAGLVREPTRGVREPTRGAREGGGNLCSRVWRGWCGVRVLFPGGDVGPDQKGQQERLLNPGLPSDLFHPVPVPLQDGGAGAARTVRTRSPTGSSCCPHYCSA